MTSFLKEYKADFRTPVPLVVWGALTIVGALSGPFGSYEALLFPVRLLFWSAVIAVGIAVGTAVRAYVRGVLGLCDFRRGSVLIACLVCLVLTPPLFAVATVLFKSTFRSLPSLFEIAVFIFFTSLSVGALRHTLTGAAGAADKTEPADPPPGYRLLQRLAPELRGDLVLISVRDHYVDVRTTRGQASLLLRFSDAMAEAGDVDGTQVHRSHWVAWDAVEGVNRAGGKVYLSLRHGGPVPVSRNHRAKLQDRGLI